jgi:hypothetical protein
MSINKKCPPGVICIENITLFFIVFTILISAYLIYINLKTDSSFKLNNNPQIIIQEKETTQTNPGFGFGLLPRPNYGYTNIPGDTLMNPYVPPLRDERYWSPPGVVPINVPTNIGAVDTSYRQIGLLTPIHSKNDKSKILPLMGRPLFTNRDKWQYYSLSDQKNSVKLPIIYKGRNATNEYGVDKIYNGDLIYVQGYNEAFKVTEYENETIRYLPFI